MFKKLYTHYSATVVSAQCQGSHRRRDEQRAVELLSGASTLLAPRQGWRGDGCGGRGLAACWPCSRKAGSCGLLTLVSGGDVASLCAGWLGGKAAHSSSSRKELGMSCASSKTACLLKDGSSYVLAWEICLAVQHTWWFTAPEKSWCAYLTHLLVVDCLLVLLHAERIKVDQGHISSLMWADVTRAHLTFVAGTLPLLCPRQHVAKQILLSKGKSITTMGTCSVSVALPRHPAPDVDKETYGTQCG